MAEPFTLRLGDCLDVLPSLESASVDSIVTDPPYELKFMGHAWDSSGIAYNPDMWAQCRRVLKPGGHVLAFSHARTYHRMAVAIEDGGFEIRDQIMWLYGSGMPKSKDISKEIDKSAGTVLDWFGPWLRQERQRLGITGVEIQRRMAAVVGGTGGAVRNWEGGYSLPSPAQFNTVCKALGLPFESIEAVEREVIGKARWKTSSAQQVPGQDHTDYQHRDITAPATESAKAWAGWGTALKPGHEPICMARKPISAATTANNVVTHGTGAINIEACRPGDNHPANVLHDGLITDWAKYFYCAKATSRDRGPGNTHPTVKPTELMRYLCRLVTPPGGVVLDPFMGSGSTGKAALAEGFRFIGIDLTSEYFEIARARLEKEV